MATPRDGIDPQNPQDVDFADLLGQPSTAPHTPTAEEQLTDPAAGQPAPQVHSVEPQGRSISVRGFVDRYRG